MEKRTFRQEAFSVIGAIVFIAAGLAALWLAKALFNIILGDAAFVALLFVPIIIYLIFSGRITEFTAPGGINAKFRTAADKPIELDKPAKIQPSVQDMQIIAKMGVERLQRMLSGLDPSKPMILTLVPGINWQEPDEPNAGHYTGRDLLEYVKALSQFRGFKFVVFVDQDMEVLAYISPADVLKILESPRSGKMLIDIVNNGPAQDLHQFPGVITKTISIQSTYIDALKVMSDQSLDALLVVNEDQKLKGIIERDQIVNKLLLAIAEK